MQKPDWPELDTAPLFTVAWLSDLHITEANSLALVKIACNTVRDSIHPNFALITGDNSGYAEPLPAEKGLPLGQRRHLWLKRFLDSELAVPYAIIPGDNWPFGFETVFGSFHRSFNFGGFHFLLTATDAMATGAEGCAVFNPETIEWTRRDLDANADKPCFFIVHETLWPPVFLDAFKTALMLNERPQVIATLSGHLHLDLDFNRGHWRQLVAPAIGRSHRPAFKLLSFHKTAVILESYEWDTTAKTFSKASKWQRIDIPEALRAGLAQAPLTGFAEEAPNSIPPAAKVINNALRGRSVEVSNALLGFAIGFGLKSILK